MGAEELEEPSVVTILLNDNEENFRRSQNTDGDMADKSLIHNSLADTPKPLHSLILAKPDYTKGISKIIKNKRICTTENLHPKE